MIKVLIIDDSVLIRKLLTEILAQHPNIEVVGTASDPYIARNKIKQLNPDVLTLDVEMPRMDGITFLRNLMKLRPMPVVMLSTLTQKGATVTLDALEIGAVDFIAKPIMENNPQQFLMLSDEICEKVINAAGAKVNAFDPKSFQQKSVIGSMSKGVTPNAMVVMGASTGGTEAIKEVLIQLPSQMVPILVTQHIPGSFSRSFAQRLDRHCSLQVVEAAEGMKIHPGYVYLAPGDKHLTFQHIGKHLVCKLSSGELVNRHRPSVEVMFDAASQSFSGSLIAVMLTGMGADGAQAMQRLSQAGHPCIVQDEESCVVYGMPKAAFDLGVCRQTTPLSKISKEILHKLNDLNATTV